MPAVFPPGVPYNETQIIQTALVLLGYPLIQSVDAGGPAAAAMQTLYGPLMASDLSSPNWRFATKVQVLSQLAGVNPNYLYYNAAYQLPADCLAVWRLWPNIPYMVFGQQLWTAGGQPSTPVPPAPAPTPANNYQLQLEYRAIVPPSMLPPSYVMYFCYLLAVTAGPGITDDPKILAQLNADMVRVRSQAMVVNSQNKPNVGNTNSPWVYGRLSGSFYGTVMGP